LFEFRLWFALLVVELVVPVLMLPAVVVFVVFVVAGDAVVVLVELTVVLVVVELPVVLALVAFALSLVAQPIHRLVSASTVNRAKVRRIASPPVASRGLG
jgi:hypothetical protein